MKVLTTAGLIKLIQLIKSSFISNTDTVTAQTITLANVATSGSYNDLSNKPTIPTKTSDIANDSGYITGISSSDVTTALGYTPANDSNAVKTTGNQTISGSKNFNDGVITVSRSGMTKGTNPSQTLYWQWFSGDKNGTGDTNCLGKVVTNVDTSGLVSTKLVAYKNATGTTSSAMGIYYPASGDAYTSAPTPATSDNSTKKIATTAFVKNQNYLTTTTKTVADSGCTFVISNGLKIITAEISGGNSSDYSWSYGTTFSKTPKVFVTRRSGDTASADVNGWVRGTIGKSSCNIFIHASGSYTFQVVAIGN